MHKKQAYVSKGPHTKSTNWKKLQLGQVNPATLLFPHSARRKYEEVSSFAFSSTHHFFSVNMAFSTFLLL